VNRQLSLSLLLWGILLTAVLGSLRPPTAVIWDDTPAFVATALQTLETWRPAAVGGRDPAYPAFLAVILGVGDDFRSVVLVQEAAWVIIILALGATTHIVTKTPYSLTPIIVLAMYPGLLIYRHIIMSEILYTFFLTLSVLGLLLATCISRPFRPWLVAAAIALAAVAVCFRSHGLLVLMATVSLGAMIARPYTPGRLGIVVLSCALAAALVTTGSRLGVSSPDKRSVIFVGKTLFCNHLNIILASEAARREIAAAAGGRADAMLARLTSDFASTRQTWPTLGFYGDECMFDDALDEYLARNDRAEPGEIAAHYRRIFLVAILDRPLLYMRKVIRQMSYGAWFSWPPHALEPEPLESSTSAAALVSEMVKRHGLPIKAITGSVENGVLARSGRPGVLLFRGLSAVFVVAILFWILTAAARRGCDFSVRAGILIIMWVASVLPVAGAHTLDIWRYLVPATPIVSLLLSIAGVEVARSVAKYRRVWLPATRRREPPGSGGPQ
jgi:hypothetical protein